MSAEDLGRVTYSFFLDYLTVQKGLRPASIRSYRDTLRLFLQFAASDAQRKITRLTLQDLTFERVKAFLQYLEEDRKNHIRNPQPASGRPAYLLRVCRAGGCPRCCRSPNKSRRFP